MAPKWYRRVEDGEEIISLARDMRCARLCVPDDVVVEEIPATNPQVVAFLQRYAAESRRLQRRINRQRVMRRLA